MATTREPGDLPFENCAFPGGVLRMKFYLSQQDGSPPAAHPDCRVTGGVRLNDE